MDKQWEENYYHLFDRLIDVLSSENMPDMDDVHEAIGNLCRLFRVNKAVTEFYRSLSHEKMKDGDVLIGYDDGKATKVMVQKRMVTKTSAVLICTVYADAQREPLTEEEMEKLERVMLVNMSFVSRRRLQYAVERMGYHDEMGYPNLRSFFRFLDMTSRDRELYGYTAIQFNLRHFTMINREIGRENGDIVIRRYVGRLKEIIGEDGIICRLGGDNFLAAFRNECQKEVLEFLQGAPIAFDESGEKRVVVNATVGVFVIPKGYRVINSGEIMDKLIPTYQAAKHTANGTVLFYSDEMLHQKNHQLELLHMFPKALKNQEFQVFYQPKVNVNSEEMVGAEALCRWIRNGEVIPPIQFIPALEQSMDICQLDFHMLDLVCKDLRRWMDEGRKIVRVSVNFSRKHMVDPDFLAHVLKIVDENRVPHEYVEVELTETTTDVEFKDLKRVVGGFQRAGIWTSMDDFGMGYSSLNLIREVPWNVLKIDKSFVPVDGDALDETTKRMYKHVVAMGRDLGLECITEGVETSQQVALLREYACDIAQGYYFDKPLPVEEFEKRLEGRYYAKANV